MITESQQQQLEKDLKHYQGFLSYTSDTIIDQDVSEYPIFVIHRQGINVGIPLNTDHLEGSWVVNASSLEEFATKQLIEPTKVDAFKSVYKSPKDFLNLFVVDGDNANFVFIPRD